MTLWRVLDKPKTDGVVHRVAPGFGHAILASGLTNVFSTLQVSAAIWQEADQWLPLHTAPSVTRFEGAYGRDNERHAYNKRQFARVHARKAIVRGSFGGATDLFVPIKVKTDIAGALVVGPFATVSATSAQILERWRWLTGRHGHLTDPDFSAFLSATLEMLVLDEGRARDFEKLLTHLATLLAGTGSADEIANKAGALRPRLESARLAENTWKAVRSMVDGRHSRMWHSAGNAAGLYRLGITKPADGVLVGLTRSLSSGRDLIEETVERHALQKHAVALGQSFGGILAGQVGDRGIVFLVEGNGKGKAGRIERLRELSERAANLARRRFGFSLHYGLSVAKESIQLAQSYQAALEAAQLALAEGRSLVDAETARHPSDHSLRKLRQELEHVVEERPDLLGPRFERYLESVAAESGQRLDLARGQLDAAFERVALRVVRSGALDEKGFQELCTSLDHEAREAQSLLELFAVYRRTITEISEVAVDPSAAKQNRSMRRALEYIQRHYQEPLPYEKVSRIAGFSPNYFSGIFKQREGMTFERYVRKLRLERAKELLTTTELAVGRIAELCGFHSSGYFSRVFREQLKKTPVAYRRRWKPKGDLSKLHKVTE